MEGIMFLGLLVGTLLAFSALAVSFGVDSRPGSDDPRQPAPGLSV